MNIATLTQKQVDMIDAEAISAAYCSVAELLTDCNSKLSDVPIKIKKHLQPAYHDFAWVIVQPARKENTRLGKAERRVIESMGFYLDSNSNYKHYKLWNPIGYPGNSIHILQITALAYASVLRTYGFNAYVGSNQLEPKYLD